MKLFERTTKEGWGNRLNLIDKNNVFVGYDYDESCCESFGYEFRTSDNKEIDYPENLSDFVFTLNHKIFEIVSKYKDDGDSAYGFEITNGEDTLWFVIYNYHNGYYSHGFEFMNDKEQITRGSL